MRKALIQKLLLSTMAVGLVTTAETSVVQAKDVIDPSLYQTMKYRSIGPFRGGRVTAVAGIKEDKMTYYMGATGGGVWKTNDGGNSWKNVSDGFFNTTGIGAIDVYDGDPNIIYVGTGEGPVRGVKTSHGDGIYKSTDGGKTWTHMGLKETRHISRLHVHPTNPDIIWVAAQGNPWGPNEERGIYKSVDGGKSWKKVLYVNEDSGFSDLSIDAHNPNNLMATSWDFRRRPWVVKSGGDGSQLWRSTDGGETWHKITAGLPQLKGKMGVSISPADPNVVYLAMEAKDGKGGMYRSDNAGKSFRQVSDEPNIFARAWYYVHVTADPNDPDQLWSMNGVLIKSIDGGKTWNVFNAPHGDHHAIWINPDDSNVMIESNDGGANVTFNGGETWSTQMNQPTGQFYRVIADNKFPYRIYSTQQDSNGIVIDSQTDGGGIGETHWQSIGSGESATVALDPEDPKYVYTTYFASFLGEWNRDTGQYRNVRPYPERVTGEMPKNLKYRANWNGPVIVSPHNPSQIYYGSQYLMGSTDRGVNWKVLSPDLTRNEKDKQGKGGYPISNEQITAESYNNLFVIAESPVKEGVIWTGSDDGLVHVTKDGGKSWDNVTPKGLKEGIINVIDASPHDAGTMYFVRAGFKMNDFTPDVYKTTNYGKSWKKIVNGIPKDTFARSIRVDPKVPGLLYLGTETGMFVSFDDGENWQSLQMNLPEVPVTDLFIRQGDLIVSTQGRSLWIMDDLNPLRQMSKDLAKQKFALLDPRDPIRMVGNGYPDGGPGKNPPSGLQVHYVINDDLPKDTAIQFDIFNSKGEMIHHDASDMGGTICGRGQAAIPRPKTISTKKGANRWVWRMNMGKFECLPELYRVSWGMDAYPAAPGNYKLRMTVGDFVQEQDFTIHVDPRLGGDTKENLAEYGEIENLSETLFKATDEMGKGVKSLRLVKEQLEMIGKLNPDQAVKEAAAQLDADIDAWIEKILQKELKTFQHVYQFEGKLMMKFKDLLGRMNTSELPLSQGFRDVVSDYMKVWAGYKTEMTSIQTSGLAAFNKIAKANNVAEVKLVQ